MLPSQLHSAEYVGCYPFKKAEGGEATLGCRYFVFCLIPLKFHLKKFSRTDIIINEDTEAAEIKCISKAACSAMLPL